MMMKLQFLKMVAREKRDVYIKPVHLKFGVALAVSVGSIFYAYFKIKKWHRSKPSSGKTKMDNINGDLRQDPTRRRVYSHRSISDRSSLGNREGLLLPEFNKLVEECDMSLATATLSPKKSEDDHMWHKDMEHQFHGHYEDKDRETTVMEPEVHSLKIESLVSHNQQLELQLVAYERLMTELEAEKAKTKMLRKKVKSEAEQSKEQILRLQDRVMKLQEHQGKGSDNESKELEIQLEEMKKSNQELKKRNSDLLQKLEYVQMLAMTALESEEMKELKEEIRHLKEHNEELTKEIDRIQADRWLDIEELVYLRWMNTCLRYELKNYKPSGDKTIPGMDISPRSEERFKRIVPDNAYKDGFPGNIELDSDQSSLTLHSSITEHSTVDHDDNLLVDQSNRSSKKKVFSKLKRLLSRKGGSSSNSDHKQDEKKPKPIQRTVSVDNITPRYSTFSAWSSDDAAKSLRDSSCGSSRRSFDLPKNIVSSNNSLRNSDVGSSSTIMRINSEEDENSLSPWNQQQQHDEKEELLKYVEALRNGRTSLRRSDSDEPQ